MYYNYLISKRTKLKMWEKCLANLFQLGLVFFCGNFLEYKVMLFNENCKSCVTSHLINSLLESY